MRRWLTWCFLVSAGIASLEALGYSLTQGAENPLPFIEFVQRFSNTCFILLVATILTWIFVWFFIIWLDGVRSGMALFFMLSFFALLGFLVVSLDILLALSPQLASYQALLMMDSVFFALVSAVLISLIVGKVSRRGRPVNLSPRAFTILAVLLTATAFAVWTRGARFPQMSGVLFWGVFAAAAVTTMVFLWWLGKKPIRLGVSLVAFAVAVFAPLFAPLALGTRLVPQLPANTDSASSHPVKHVILITIDTLRRDALGCYNANTANTPHIDQFARDSVLFTNAFSSAPWTYPAVASILTGLAPRVHQLIDGRTKLPENVPTMAEYMRSAGYYTAALGYNSILLPRSRLDRGFQEYNWFPSQALTVKNFEVGLTHELSNMTFIRKPSTAQLTDQAIQWFKDNAQQDAFFWLHYFDPHIPYMPPAEFLPTDPKQRAMGALFWDVKLARGGGVARTAEERAWIRALYDGEVRYMDAEIGRLLDSLKKLGIYDDALIVLTTDHGEEFWDHDRFEHGPTLFNELIHVPFLIKLPQDHRGKTVDACVTTQAIMPTILNLCGVAPNAAEALPPPLSPLLDDAQEASHKAAASPEAYNEQPIFSGASLFHDHAESVIFNHMKYIRQTISGHEMLFNLKEDPKELNSLAAQDPQNLDKGRQLLDAQLEAAPRTAEKLGIRLDEKDRLDQRDVLSLQALGYL